MPLWLWFAIGLGGFAVLSVVIGLALAAILGALSRDVSQLHEQLDQQLLEDEAWATQPVTRAATTAGLDRADDFEQAQQRLKLALHLLDRLALWLLEAEIEALRQDDPRLNRIFALIGELRAETRNVFGSLEQSRGPANHGPEC